MRSFRRLIIALMAVLVLPFTTQLFAQGPVPQGPAPKASAPAAASAPPAGQATRNPPPLDAIDLETWLDGFMPYALERGSIAGAVVVVVRGNGTVLQKGYGYADYATRKPVSPDATLFRPGSISKLLTWTAVMQQVEAGRIDLDKDVNSYLDFTIPAFDGKPVTMRNIMTHTAGFEESVRHLITSDPKAALPLGRLVKVTLPQRVFAPGTTPAYSNYATGLAGYIVERVSGMSFDAYVEQRIFAPLGMTRSSFRQPLPDALKPLMSSGYPDVNDKAKPFEIVAPAPAGSLSSTGADMGKFMMAHLTNNGVLMKPETMRMMHDFRAPGIGPLNTMALGFYEQWVNGQRSISHGGDTQWFHSDLWLFPESDVGLYISMNSSGTEGAAHAVRSALFHKFADRYLPGTDPIGKVDDATARQHAALLAGNYVSSRGSFTNFLSVLNLLGQSTVTVGEDGKIAFPALDGLSAGARDWVEVAPFVWRDTNTGERLAAVVKDGKVVRFSVDVGSPFMVFEPAPAGLNTVWLVPALLLALGIILLAALAWPVRALVRRSYGQKLALQGRSRLAYRLSRGFAWLVLAAVAGWMGLIAAFSADLGSIGGPLDWLIILLRVISPIAAIGLVASSGWLLWLAFASKRRWTARLGALLLLLAGLVVLWVVVSSHLYGFNMVY
ncbi:serine hydrolase domain-containing protein [Sphingomonas hengshuiensis]|nr:serine hydrolase domain-containing protein [Sphingomonas hengshuiensis]